MANSQVQAVFAAMSPEEKKAYKATTFRGTCMGLTCFSAILMQGASVPYHLLPWLRYLYPERGERFAQAMLRHVRFLNITPVVYNVILGIVMVMEKEYRDNPDTFDPNSIQAIKAALMGPLSGIGDAIFWVTVRTIAASVAISFAQQGNPIAPFVFLFIFHAISTPTRILCMRYSFAYGTAILQSAYESGIIEIIVKAASTVGLIMVGAMTASFVKVTTAIKLTETQTLQSALDAIVPGLLPLTVTLLCVTALKKGLRPTHIICIMLVVGIIGKLIGVF